MKIQTHQHVAEIVRHQIIQADHDHVHAAKARHRADVFNLQRIDRARGVLRVRGQGTCALALQKIQVRAE